MPTPATTSACEGQTMGATERSNLAIASRRRDGTDLRRGNAPHPTHRAEGSLAHRQRHDRQAEQAEGTE